MKTLLCLLCLFSTVSLQAAGEGLLSTPIKKFRLPTFNQEGFRTSLLEGDEAVLVSEQRIDVKEMHFSVFSGTEESTVETTLLAPLATLQMQSKNDFSVSGAGAVRLIRSDVDATGEQWTFEFKEEAQKRLLMKKNVRVVFRAVLKDILK